MWRAIHHRIASELCDKIKNYSILTVEELLNIDTIISYLLNSTLYQVSVECESTYGERGENTWAQYALTWEAWEETLVLVNALQLLVKLF